MNSVASGCSDTRVGGLRVKRYQKKNHNKKNHLKSSGAWIPFPSPCFKGPLSVCDVGTIQQLFGLESELVLFNLFSRFYLVCKSQDGLLCLSL